MNTAKHQEYMRQAQHIMDTIPDEDRLYHIERITRAYVQDIDPETRPLTLALLEHFFPKLGQFIRDTMRDDAIWPENVVQSDPILSLQTTAQK